MPQNLSNMAPDFSLPDQSGKPITLSTFRGHPVILFFYPKAFTTGCTAEVCSFRDGYGALTAAGVTVLGISPDPPNTLKNFAEQNRLPFPLLSDTDGRVRAAYGVSHTLGLFPQRKSFVIDPSGRIVHTFNSQFRPTSHIAKALDAIKRLPHPKT